MTGKAVLLLDGSRALEAVDSRVEKGCGRRHVQLGALGDTIFGLFIVSRVVHGAATAVASTGAQARRLELVKGCSYPLTSHQKERPHWISEKVIKAESKD